MTAHDTSAPVSGLEVARRRFGLHSPTFGRDALLRELEGVLDSGVRSVALCGAPGMGKTRMVRELAARRACLEASPVFFADWSAFTSFDAACGALGATLGATQTAALEGAMRMQDDCLILIDNVEQFQPELEEALARWKADAPAAQFVVSSRRRIAVDGSTVVNVPALPTDSPASPGCELLSYHFDRQNGVDHAEIQTLAELAGGVPLALGLVAGRAAALGTSSVIEALRSETHLDDLARSMDVSWSFLSEELRSFLAQLCCFHGGVTRAEIDAVVDTDLSADDALVRLIRESLVEVDRSSSTNRYYLVVTVPTFCRRKGADAYAAATRRHQAYYADRSEELVVSRHRGSPGDARMLRDMRFNIQRAFDTAHEAGHFDDAMRCALALTRPRYVRRPADASLSILDRALALEGGSEALRHLGQLVRARTETRRGMFDNGEAGYRTILRQTDASPWVQGRAQGGLAALLMAQWKVDEAVLAAEAALPLHREAGDLLGEAWTLLSMSGAASFRGEHDRALEHLLRSVDIARRQKADGALVSFLMNVALLHLNRSDTVPARRCLQEAHGIETAFGDGPGHPWIHYARGIVEVLDGHNDRGAVLLARAVRATCATGETRLRASALCGLAELARLDGRPASAREHIEEALSLVQNLTPVACRIRAVRASLLAEQGRTSEARLLMEGIRRDANPGWPERDLSFLDLEEARVLLASLHFEAPAAAGDFEARSATLVARAEEVIERWPESVSKVSLQQFRARPPIGGSEPASGAKLVLRTSSRTLEWNGNSLQCQRRPVLWRLFLALSECPDGLASAELIARIWQGEQMSPASARNRLHVAISSARKMTDPQLIELVDGAYRLSTPAAWDDAS